MSNDTNIPAEAVDIAAVVFRHAEGSVDERIAAALEAAAPYLLSAKVAEARANNDHISEGGDGYSAGFHYALHCMQGDVE